MPADRRRIKENLRAEQAGDSRGFGVPLIPADQHANVRVARFPDSKSTGALMIAIVGDVRIAGREIKLLVEQRIVGDVHLAIGTQQSAIGIDVGGGNPIDTFRVPQDDWYYDCLIDIAIQQWYMH